MLFRLGAEPALAEPPIEPDLFVAAVTEPVRGSTFLFAETGPSATVFAALLEASGTFFFGEL